jgi:colanic acid/amylovoran biosynthesis protein
MRVIVATGLNTGAAEYQNLGDVAMLQVAVARLLRLWPGAQVEVLTESASDLARFCPGAKPLPRLGCNCWVGNRVLLGRYHQFLPGSISVRSTALKRAIGLRWPRILEFLINLRFHLFDENGQRERFNVFMESLRNADLLVVCGSGGFADSCQEWNLTTLGTIEAALRRSIPVAMFGQGMGPLTDPVSFSRGKKVLPAVDLIGLRGSRGGVELLKSMGVNLTEVLTTGDEAIELAYAARVEEPGDAVGINLRVASYAGTKPEVVQDIASVLQQFARRHKVPLLPVPIAFHEYANDHLTIRRLLTGFDDQSDGGLSLDSPLMVIKQVARCRILVTGAYHAAVFALAQGIPVVCLASSAYYLAKFQGLEDLFGIGCATVILDEPDWPSRLAVAMEKTWASAETVRSPLLHSALQQIVLSRGAYQRVGERLHSESRLPDFVISEDMSKHDECSYLARTSTCK